MIKAGNGQDRTRQYFSPGRPRQSPQPASGSPSPSASITTAPSTGSTATTGPIALKSTRSRTRPLNAIDWSSSPCSNCRYTSTASPGPCLAMSVPRRHAAVDTAQSALPLNGSDTYAPSRALPTPGGHPPSISAHGDCSFVAIVPFALVVLATIRRTRGGREESSVRRPVLVAYLTYISGLHRS